MKSALAGSKVTLFHVLFISSFLVVPANRSWAAGEDKETMGLPQLQKMEPAEIARGESVTFTGKNFPDKERIVIFLNGKESGTACYVNDDKTTFTFCVPASVSLGRAKVRVDFSVTDKFTVPLTPKTPPDGYLTIHNESGKQQPKITRINPLLSYPEKELYGFDVLGEGFSNQGTDNGLIFENRGEIPVCWEDDNSCNQDDPKLVSGKVVNSRQLNFKRVPQEHQGENAIQVRVGQAYSNSFRITLSRVDKGTPILISLLVFGVLILLIVFLTGRKLGTHEIADQKYGFFSALFLDMETDTFSLSRFQFFVWTGVSILGYLYLMLSRSLVQWKLDFVDIPPGLPGIIFISATTTVLASGIANAKGPQGAGNVQPSMADFISTGAVVVPERFQFFVWTILGAIAFILLVILQDPGTIKDLPEIPTGFLQLMGVSSAGYLGGKLARKSGPVIDEIQTKYGSLELKIIGRSLSEDAGFRIGDDEVTASFIKNKSGKPEKEGKPEIVEQDDQTNDQKMAKTLRLTIDNPKTEWLKDDSNLTIINPDGQKAVWPYKVGPIITNIQPDKVSKEQSTTLKVSGHNFEQTSTVAIENEEAKALPVATSMILKNPNEVEVTVDLKGTTAKAYILRIARPDNRSGTREFKVE